MSRRMGTSSYATDCTKEQKNIHFYSCLYVVESSNGIVDKANDEMEVLQFGRELLLVSEVRF